MARTSDTRKKVRAAALELIGNGTPVTSRKVRELMGAGSFATITDELKKWETERLRADGTPAASVRQPLTGRPQSLEDLEEHGANDALSQTDRSDLEAPPAAIAALSTELLGQLAGLRVQLEAVIAELALTRKSNEEQLAIAYQRYEGVQRHAMVQIDEARQLAAELRQRLALVTKDFETREDAQRGKIQSLRDENVRLRERNEILQSFVTVPSR